MSPLSRDQKGFLTARRVRVVRISALNATKWHWPHIQVEYFESKNQLQREATQIPDHITVYVCVSQLLLLLLLPLLLLLLLLLL